MSCCGLRKPGRANDVEAHDARGMSRVSSVVTSLTTPWPRLGGPLFLAPEHACAVVRLGASATCGAAVGGCSRPALSGSDGMRAQSGCRLRTSQPEHREMYAR